MKPLALVISDLHFRSNGRTFPNRDMPVGDLEFSLHQVLQHYDSIVDAYGIHRSQLPLIVAGDVFDTKACQASTVEMAQRFFSGIFPTYFIQGQHDATVPPWLSVVDSKSVHIHRKWINLGGYDFVGLDYFYDPKTLEAFLEENKDRPPYVLVTHFPFFFVEEGFRVLEKYDNLLLVLSGDYHVPMCRVLANGTRFYSIGALNPNKLNDTNSYSFLVLFQDDSGLQVTEIPLHTRVVLDRVIKGEEDIQALVDEVRGAIENAPHEVIRKPVVVIRCPDPSLLVAARYALEESCWLFVRPQAEAGIVLPQQEDSSSGSLQMEDLKSVLREYYSGLFGPEYGNAVSLLFEAGRAAGSARVLYIRRALQELWSIFQERMASDESGSALC